MSRPRIAIRADASSIIGGGHVMRCLTLADELKRRGADIAFICRSIPAVLRQRIVSLGHDLVMLPAVEDGGRNEGPPHARWLDVSWRTDAEQTLEALRQRGGADWLVVDHYALDARWQTALRGQARRIMVIDDLADRPHDCDLLLDQTLGRIRGDYENLVPPDCRMLLGAQYALLRKNFRALRPSALNRRARTRRIERMLVSFGGGDPLGLTHKTLQVISGVLPPETRIDLALGAASAGDLGLEDVIQSMPQSVQIHDFSADMARLMHDADLAIGAGGMSAWERCCLGLPALTAIIAGNQENGSLALERAGAARLFSAENLKAQLAELLNDNERRRDISINASRILHGEGAWLAVTHIIPGRLKTGSFLAFVPLEMRHADLILSWQRDKGARRFSRNPHPPSREEHMSWMRGTLDNPLRDCWIMEIDGAPAGIIRLDFDMDGTSEISILVSASFRSAGAGRAALDMVGEYFSWTDITAFVHEQNIHSLRLFSGAGYQRVSNQPDRNGFLRLVRKRKA